MTLRNDTSKRIVQAVGLGAILLALVGCSPMSLPDGTRASHSPLASPAPPVDVAKALAISGPTPLITAVAPMAAYSPSPTPSPIPEPAPTDTPLPTPTAEPVAAEAAARVVFAVIGDNGMDNEAEGRVASLVSGWRPDFVISLGDGYYWPAGGEATEKYDRATGGYYCAFLKDITTTGSRCSKGLAERNRFFPSIGNHDYSDAGLGVYLEYFSLPGAGFTSSSGNERYYDFAWEPLHFFVLNSNGVEPDGVVAGSKQAQWLKNGLAASNSAWNLIYFHHPPYSSGATHGSYPHLRWPFQAWGADAVLSGHEHFYERIMAEGMVYFVNGVGGGSLYPFASQPIAESAVRVGGEWGAQKVTAAEQRITFEFFTVDGELRDSYTIEKPLAHPAIRLILPMVLAR